MPFAEKFLRLPGVIDVAGRRVKRYHVTTIDTDAEDTVQKAAYEFLPRLLAPCDDTPPAAFVVLHRGQGSAVYLNAYSWVWDNVIECHVAAAGVPFLGCPDEDPTTFIELVRPWIGCVWELPALEHERSAWVRHMLVPDQPDLSAYLADLPADRFVGGPR